MPLAMAAWSSYVRTSPFYVSSKSCFPSDIIGFVQCDSLKGQKVPSNSGESEYRRLT